MSRIVFLLEERSMQVLLDGLLPRLFPDLSFLCVPHEGKRDLELSIPRKLRAWREPDVSFAVIRDNDGGDCVRLKAKLKQLCNQNGRGDTLIRIACQELEAWYLGEPAALADAFDKPALQNLGRQAKFREPDALKRPAAEIERLIPEFQKVSGAQRMAGHLTRERNRSSSFRALMEGIEAMRQAFVNVPQGRPI